MAGTFELKASAEQFMFNLKVANGERILTSERSSSCPPQQRSPGLAHCTIPYTLGAAYADPPLHNPIS